MAKQSKNKEIQAYLETRSKELEKLIEADKFERHHYRKFFEDLAEKFFDKEQPDFEGNIKYALDFLVRNNSLSFFAKISINWIVERAVWQLMEGKRILNPSLIKIARLLRDCNLDLYLELFNNHDIIEKFREIMDSHFNWYVYYKRNPSFGLRYQIDENGQVEELDELDRCRLFFDYTLEKNGNELTEGLKRKIVRFLKQEGLTLLLEKGPIEPQLFDQYLNDKAEAEAGFRSLERNFERLTGYMEQMGEEVKRHLIDSIRVVNNRNIEFPALKKYFRLFDNSSQALEILFEVLREEDVLDEFAFNVLTQRDNILDSPDENFTIPYHVKNETKKELYIEMVKSLPKILSDEDHESNPNRSNPVKNLVEYFDRDIYFLIKGKGLKEEEKLGLQKQLGKYILNNQSSLDGQIKNCFVVQDGKEDILRTIDFIEKEAIENKDSEDLHQAWDFYKNYQKGKLDGRALKLLKELETNDDKGEFHKSYLANEIIYLESDDGIKKLIDVSIEWIYENKYLGVVDRIGEQVMELPIVIPYLIKYFQNPQITDGRRRNQIEKRIEDEVKKGTGIEDSLRILKNSLNDKSDPYSKTNSFLREDITHQSNGEKTKPKLTEDKKSDQKEIALDKIIKKSIEEIPLLKVNLEQETDKVKKWVFGISSESKIYLNLVAGLNKDEIKTKELVALADDIIELLIKEKKEERALDVRKWSISVIRKMSEPDSLNKLYSDKLSLLKNKFSDHHETIENFYEKLEKTDKEIKIKEEIKDKLRLSVSQVISKELKKEENPEIVEHMVAIIIKIGNLSSRDALASTILGSEKEKSERQNLLYDYYLQPAKKRSNQAANLLKDAVYNAKRTMRILQILNIMTFLIGATLLVGGIIVTITSQEWGTRLAGVLSSIGGIVAIVTIFLREPLKRIQIAIGDLVQIQTAFTGFIWGLNLNGTYIQSQYVAEGTLTEFDINQAVKRIDKAMDKTSYLIEHYTADNETDIPAYISQAIPQQGNMNTVITLLGHGLKGRRRDMNLRSKEAELKRYQIALNGQKIYGKTIVWRDDQIVFQLKPEYFEETDFHREDLRISVFIDDKETNGISFQLEELQMGTSALGESLIARLAVLLNSKQGIRMPRRVREEISQLISEDPKKDDKKLPTLTAANEDTKSRNIDPESSNNLYG